MRLCSETGIHSLVLRRHNGSGSILLEIYQYAGPVACTEETIRKMSLYFNYVEVSVQVCVYVF